MVVVSPPGKSLNAKSASYPVAALVHLVQKIIALEHKIIALV